MIAPLKGAFQPVRSRRGRGFFRRSFLPTSSEVMAAAPGVGVTAIDCNLTAIEAGKVLMHGDARGH